MLLHRRFAWVIGVGLAGGIACSSSDPRPSIEAEASIDAGSTTTPTDAGSPSVEDAGVDARADADAGAGTGEFRTVGTKIIDPNGVEFVADGVNMGTWNKTTQFDDIVHCWGFNSIRIHTFLLGSYGKPNPKEDDYAELSEIVDKFTAAHIVVIFDANDRIGSYYADGPEFDTLTQFWTDMATRFKTNPYVWFDLHNEPDKLVGDFERWTSYHQRLIRLVRDTVGANNIVLVEGTSWGQDAGDYGKNLISPAKSAILTRGDDLRSFGGKTYANIVFSFHVYEQWNASAERIADYVDRVHAKGFPLVVGEYGSFNNESTLAASNNLFEIARGRKLGRLVWAWDGTDPNDLTKSGDGSGALVDDCSAPSNLTPLGQLTWNALHGKD